MQYVPNKWAPNTNRINVNDQEQVKYWTEQFKVSREQLIRAVKEVGPSVNKVSEYLGKQ